MDRRIEESPAMTLGYFLGRYIDIGIKAMIWITLVKWSGVLD